MNTKFFLKWAMILFAIPLFLANVFVFAMNTVFAQNNPNIQNTPTVSVAQSQNVQTIKSQTPAKTQGLSGNQSSGSGEGYESENFKIEQIQFGEDTTIPIDNSENLPLQISDVLSNAFINSDGTDAQITISWKTNKLAISQVESAESLEQSPEVVFSEKNYGFNHSVVLTGLNLSSTYFFRIKCVDQWGNQTESDYYGVYTGTESESVFELIGKNLQDIFGWALKKQ